MNGFLRYRSDKMTVTNLGIDGVAATRLSALAHLATAAQYLRGDNKPGKAYDVNGLWTRRPP